MRKFFIAGLALLFVAAAGSAQDTPTEREAARDIVKQIHELDQSLGVPQMAAKLMLPDQARDQVIARVKQLI